MYNDFYGFSEKPFTITPNPRFIFLSRNHKEVFGHLLYGLQQHAGFIEVTGEVGTGKTTVLRTLLGQLDGEAYRVALILNPSLSAGELLRSINREFGIATEGESGAQLIEALNAFLLRENAAGRTVVLVIDEAQNLAPEVLEQVRLLSNLETETDKLIQIVLVGQPELAELLGQQELRQLSQRITVRYHLRPMDLEDTCSYVRHRLAVAGAGAREVFTVAALRRVFRLTGGYPRLINILCDRALLVGYAENAARIAPAQVRRAAGELKRLPSATGSGRRRLWAAGIAAALVVVAGVYWLAPRRFDFSRRGAGNARPTAQGSDIPPRLRETGGAAQPGPERSLSSLQRALDVLGERQSAAEAFSSLAKAWGGKPLSAGSTLTVPEGLRAAVAGQGLEVSSLKSTVDGLARLKTPALLELSLPGRTDSRYLALQSVVGQHVVIAPPLEGRRTLSIDELREIWFGHGYLIWKNYLEIPFLAARGRRGPGVARLQALLSQAGCYQGQVNGIYDAATIRAVTRFQGEKGIAQDGRVGAQTLVLLYQASGRFSAPRASTVVAGGGS